LPLNYFAHSFPALYERQAQSAVGKNTDQFTQSYRLDFFQLWDNNLAPGFNTLSRGPSQMILPGVSYVPHVAGQTSINADFPPGGEFLWCEEAHI
jgi:hypothetical protein